MKKIYLVKKNPALPAGEDNWIIMNASEFAVFISTPEGEARRRNFGRLNACDVDDEIIYAECGIDVAKEWKSVQNRSEYIENRNKQTNFKVVSYNAYCIENESITGEELLEDSNCNVEDEVIRKTQIDLLYISVGLLEEIEQEAVKMMFLSEDKLTETEFGDLFGMNRNEVHYLKMCVIKKLRKLMKFGK